MSDELKCQKCRQLDMVQKLSVLYQAGTSKVQYQTWMPPPAGTNWAPLLTKREGTNQTALSARFAPPSKPSLEVVKPPPFESRPFLMIALPLLMVGLVMSLRSSFLFLACLFFGLALIPIIIGLVRQQQGKERIWRESVLPRWKRAMTKWNSLFYCARDDGVFLPEDGVWVSAERFWTFLWE